MRIQKFTLGTPEEIVPSRYCQGFHYEAGEPVTFDTGTLSHYPRSGGYRIDFPLAADEQVYGFGLQLKEFNHKGKKVVLRNNSDPIKPTGDSHAPVPFFVTTKGRGFYFDTARAAEFYCGYPLVGKGAQGGMSGSTEGLYATRLAPGETVMSIRIPGAAGVDMYVIEGNTITDVVSGYNMLSGGGCEVPEWGLGMLFRCYYKYTEKEILEIAREFREKDIPCSVIGLEPGWQTQTYSCSYVPSPERYPHFYEMLDELKAMGYHVNLWEHCFTHPTSPIYEALKPYAGTFPVWNGLVPDFTQPEAKQIFSDYHKKVLTERGVDGFKLDECDGSDYTGSWSFPNSSEFPCGADGEQMHALLGTLYTQTIQKALGGTPTLSEVRSLGALAASYPFVLYSDLYDHHDFVEGVVNQGFSGLLWSPEVRSVKSKEELIRRLQTVVFSSQCLVNAWCCEERYPWLPYEGCEDEVRELFRLRKSLIPRLMAAHKQYKETGKPPIRALVMDYTSDPNTWNLDDEYLFCDNLLVAPILAGQTGRTVYLPAGNWVDFYTGAPVPAGSFRVETDKIPVYRSV